MAFKLNSGENFSQPTDLANNKQVKTSSQLLKEATNLASFQLASKTNNSNRAFPAWLKDGSTPKQLPAIYLGVLGQVQLQSSFIPPPGKSTNKLTSGEYMNRFTDTDRVYQLLSASRLSNEVLATIWAHVNKTFPGRLTNREVCLALALVAIFQQLESSSNHNEKLAKDPFTLIRQSKTPPVPKLYPNDSSGVTVDLSESPEKTTSDRLETKVPKNLATTKSCRDSLLVNFDDALEKLDSTNERTGTSGEICRGNSLLNSFNLIDCDYYKFTLDLAIIEEVWFKFLTAIRAIYKRSYDILNVENSRTSALEALGSQQGKKISLYLCLTYPLAHNIKIKIHELYSLELNSKPSTSSSEPRGGKLLSKEYISTIDDLMNSVNEYWAVLINLFHESGQTKFIEAIMDGLMMPKCKPDHESEATTSALPSGRNKKVDIDQIAKMLSGYNQPDVCSICYSKFYLPNMDTSQTILDDEITGLMSYQNPISSDNHYYYHPKCANFWLNHTGSNSLPFVEDHRDKSILIPATKTPDQTDSLI